MKSKLKALQLQQYRIAEELKRESELCKQGGSRIFVKQVNISQKPDQVKKQEGKEKQEKGRDEWREEEML